MKKLVSVRLKVGLLNRIDHICDIYNSTHVWKTPSRNYYYSLYGYMSRADIIELALEEFFKKHENDDLFNSPG